jgi:hypothetical protein
MSEETNNTDATNRIMSMNILDDISSIEKSKALALILHCADISHPGKPWTIHYSWTEYLMEEYFTQGQREKELGLPCSPLCDRDNTLVAESQIGLYLFVGLLSIESIRFCSFVVRGFIQYIVEPSFVVMGDMLEKILRSMVLVDSELPSPLLPMKSMSTSPSSVPSNDDHNEPSDHG